MTGGTGQDYESAASGMTPHGLHLDYDMDFQSQRVGDIAPNLMSPLLPTLVSDLLCLEGPQSVGPPPPQLTLPQAPSQLPPTKEPNDQETYSPGSPSSNKGDSMSAMSFKLEAPTLLKVCLLFKKGKKTKSSEAPDEEPASQLGFPFGDDDDDGSIVTVSDEDGSNKGGAGTSTQQSAPASGQKQGLEDQTLESLTPKKPAMEEASIPP